MDAIKKNIGFISYCLVCTILMVILGLAIRHVAKVVATNQEEIAKQEEFFKRIGTGEFALTGYNVEIARKNRDVALQALGRFREQLHSRSSVKREYIGPLGLAGHLREEFIKMRKQLMDKDILLAENCRYFSFDRIARANRPPPAAAIPPILKQVRIVKEIVKIAAGSYIREFAKIDRPKGFQTVEQDGYAVTPFSMQVTGGLEEIRDFVNSLQDKAEYLFFLRSVEVTALVTGMGEGEDRDSGTGEEDGYYEDGMDMMDGEGGGYPGRTERSRMRRPPGRTRAPGSRTLPGRGTGDLSALDARLAQMQEEETELSVEDRLVFTEERLFVADLNFDLVEFPPAEGD